MCPTLTGPLEKINSSIRNACIRFFSFFFHFFSFWDKKGYFIKSQLIYFSFVICWLDSGPSVLSSTYADNENELETTAKDINKNCLVIYQVIGDFFVLQLIFSTKNEWMLFCEALFCVTATRLNCFFSSICCFVLVS